MISSANENQKIRQKKGEYDKELLKTIEATYFVDIDTLLKYNKTIICCKENQTV